MKKVDSDVRMELQHVFLYGGDVMVKMIVKMAQMKWTAVCLIAFLKFRELLILDRDHKAGCAA